MIMKKIIGLLLVALTAATMLTSCGKNTSIDTKKIMERNNVESYSYPKQIKIKIPVYDRGVPGQANVTDNYWTKYIQKNFGDKHNIKVEFISIPRKEEITAFNQLLAGKKENQPDIIFNYDYSSIVSFANQDVFQTLNSEMIKKYAPTFYEKTKPTDKYTYFDDKKIFLAATRPQGFSYVTVIRKDWMDKLGIGMPKNLGEHINMLKLFRDNKLGGENTVPETKVLANANYGAHLFRPYPMPEDELAFYSDITVSALTYEPVKKQLQYENMLFNEGLISSEWYLDKDATKAREAFISGRSGIFGFYLTKNSDILVSLKQNCPNAEVSIFPSNGGIDGSNFSGRADFPFGIVSGINKNCMYPEAVLMYFEWLSKPENLFVMQNGIHNVTYKMDRDIPTLIDGYKGEERLNYGANKDLWCLVIEGVDLNNETLNVEAAKKMFSPVGYEYLIEDVYKNWLKTKEYFYTDYMFEKPVTTLTEYGETLKNKWQIIQTDLIICKPEEFEAKYEAACKDYLEAGYQKVLDEKKKLYDEQKSQHK